MNENTQALPEVTLTDKDIEKIRGISGNIDLTDTALCLTYGTAEQKKLASVSDKLFRLAAGNDDSAQIGEKMNSLIKELRDVSAVRQRSGLSAWLFRRRDLRNLRKRCEAAAKKADCIAAELEKHRNTLLCDFVMLGKLYDSVLEQHRELTVLVEAGQRKLEEDPSAEKELRERFEKRLHDLKLSRMVCMQILTQIRVLQGCNTALSEKIQSLLTNTAALWKSQTAFALAARNTGQAMVDLRKANESMIGALEDVHTAEHDILREAAAMEELVQPDKA